MDKRKKHGYASYRQHSKTYNIWSCMIQRCTNPNNTCYERYGGRGIKVCERWGDFRNFLEDMGEAPEGMQIDRMNNDGNYEKDNCRWATNKEQANNRRSNVHYEYGGNKYTLSQLADIAGISLKLMWYRLSKGWTIQEAVSKPKGKGPNLIGDRRAVKSDAKLYDYHGEKKTARELSSILGISQNAIRKRIKNGTPL